MRDLIYFLSLFYFKYMPKIDLKKAIKESGGDELDYLDLVDPLHWECYCGSCVFFWRERTRNLF